MHAAAVGGVRGPARGVVEDVADLRAERDRLRQQLTAAHRTYDAADSLRYSFGAAGGLTPGGVLTAAAIRDAQRRADEAAQQARSEIAAAQQAHDNLAALHNARRIDLAAALDAPHTASWPDLIEIAQQAQQADAAVNEAVRARKAAEQRARDTAATLREAENQLAKVRQRAERSDREGELLSAELTKAEAVAREAKKLLERRTETLRKRAEHVEAQVRAVREAIAHDFRADHRAIIEAALDGTAVPDADAPRPFSLTEQAAPRPLSGPCGRCGATTQHCDPRGRFVCREHNLAAYTTPITPREPQNVRTGDGHPVFELIDALTDSSALADEAASALIGRYYRAITSAPPADPAERPLAVAVHVDLTPEQLAEAARKAVEERARWQQRLREAVKP
jgi:chaperonin cofactor prefoldin